MHDSSSRSREQQRPRSSGSARPAKIFADAACTPQRRRGLPNHGDLPGPWPAASGSATAASSATRPITIATIQQMFRHARKRESSSYRARSSNLPHVAEKRSFGTVTESKYAPATATRPRQTRTPCFAPVPGVSVVRSSSNQPSRHAADARRVAWNAQALPRANRMREGEEAAKFPSRWRRFRERCPEGAESERNRRSCTLRGAAVVKSSSGGAWILRCRATTGRGGRASEAGESGSGASADHSE